MGYRAAIQEDEAEFSVTLFLWWKCKCHLHASLVYVNRTASDDSHSEDGYDKKGLFGGGIPHPDTFDKPSWRFWAPSQYQTSLF